MAHNVNDLSVNLSIASLNDITTLETPGFTGAGVKYLSTTKGQVTYSSNALPDKDLTVIYTTNNPALNGDMLFYNAVSDIVNTGENNLFAGSDAIVLGKYSGTGTITSDIAATTRTGSRNFENSFTAVSKPENAFIPRLWAYMKIRKLMDRIDVEGETDTLTP